MKKSNTLRLSLAALAAMLLLWGCGPSVKTIVIISTNDIHGQIDNFPRLAALVEQYRMQDTAAVVLVDAGDRWTGNPYVDRAPLVGSPVMELMDSLGYDAVTFGNHEFDFGAEVLNDRIAAVQFPAVLANINTRGSALDQPAPYTIIDAGGVKVGIVGLVIIAKHGHPEGDDDVFEGMTFSPPVETARRYAALRDSCDVLVALTHTGCAVDSVLIDSVRVFDAVIGGHTHTVIDPGIMLGNTMLTQTGSGLRSAGITVFRLRRGKVVSVTNRLVNLKDIAPDSRFEAMVEGYRDIPFMQRVLTRIEQPMELQGAANMFADMIRRRMKTDLAVYHLGGVRTEGMSAGEIKVSDIYSMEPFGCRAYRVSMTADDLKRLIMNKYNGGGNPKESHARDLFPSGFGYTIVTDKDDMCVDVEFDFGVAKRLFSVAVGDYIYNNYDFDRPWVEGQSPLLTDIFMDELSAQAQFVPDNSQRIDIRRRK